MGEPAEPSDTSAHTDDLDELAVRARLADSARHAFPCDHCGARLRWDPDADALRCDHCEHVQAVPRAEGTLLERPLAAAGDAARGLGLELRVSVCDECGARVTFEQAGTATTCAFCGSASVMDQAASRNALRPESLVPLDVAREQVQAAFTEWVSGLWFRPNALRRVERVEARGLYVPFWTFDCAVHSDWSADAGYYYYVTQTYTTRQNGRTVTRTRRVRKVRWEPAWGQRDDVHDDLLIAASRGLSAELLAELGDFDTTALVPYRPEYLAGWSAEEYQLDLEDGWHHGQERVEAIQRERCAGDVPGDTQRRLAVQNTIADVTWKHVLLPVWSLTYRYGGKAWPVLVNGQTGRVVGQAPWSWVKIGLAVLAGLAVAGTAALLSSR